MPLYKHFKHQFIEVAIWEITEPIADLAQGINLHQQGQEKFDGFKSPQRKREFLASRQALKVIFGQNPAIHYKANGKPYLPQGGYISFSHTHQFAAVIYSQKLEVGVDIERFREGIGKIQRKFMRPQEYKTLSETEPLEHLTAYWGAKEVVVKIEGNRQLDFKEEIKIQPFLAAASQSTIGVLSHKEQLKKYSLQFKTYPNLILTYGWHI